jgi:MATE family multidrug resistance protein
MSRQAAGATSPPGAVPHPIRDDLVELARLAGPVVISRLGIMTMGVSDAIVIGRYSAVQLGYHAMAWSVASVMVTASLGLLLGVQVMASRAVGEGRPREAGAVLRRGLVYALWLGLAAGALLAGFGPLCLRALRLRGDLAAGATAPLLIFALSMPSFTLSVAASSWLEGLGRPTPPMLLMWAANAANLTVDLLLVPGAFGLPALGAVGGACATLIGRTLLAVATLAYIARMSDARALGVFQRAPRDRSREREQRRIGYGGGSANFFEVTAFSSMNVLAGWIGALAVAAWAVVLNVVALAFMVPLGLGTATAVMVGRAHGARDPAAMLRAALIGCAVSAIFACLVALAVWPNARFIALIFTTNPDAVVLAAAGVALACLMLPLDALQVVTAQGLRARGDILAPTLTHMTSYTLVMAPLAWVLAFPLGLGLTGVIWAVIGASLLAAGLLLARLSMLARRG